MANTRIGKLGKIAIALGVVAGVLCLSRVIYNYHEHGTLDVIKLVMGIGIPLLMYVLVKSAASAE